MGHATAQAVNRPFPVPLIKLAARVLPWPVLRQLGPLISLQIRKLHPNLRERLAVAEGKRYALQLTDLPLTVSVTIRDGGMDVRFVPEGTRLSADVRVTAASSAFLDMLEGRCDGDALFFARDLSVEGDTEALLVLRNALDGEPIDIRADLFSVFGPASGPVQKMLSPLQALGLRIADGVQRLQEAVIAPVVVQQRQQGLAIADVMERLGQLEKRMAGELQTREEGRRGKP